MRLVIYYTPGLLDGRDQGVHQGPSAEDPRDDGDGGPGLLAGVVDEPGDVEAVAQWNDANDERNLAGNVVGQLQNNGPHVPSEVLRVVGEETHYRGKYDEDHAHETWNDKVAYTERTETTSHAAS